MRCFSLEDAHAADRFEVAAMDLLRRVETGEKLDPAVDWLVHRRIILSTPQFELGRQVEHPLLPTRERVLSAIEAYNAGEQLCVQTHIAGWV